MGKVNLEASTGHEAKNRKHPLDCLPIPQGSRCSLSASKGNFTALISAEELYILVSRELPTLGRWRPPKKNGD